MTDSTVHQRPRLALDCIYYAFAIGFSLYMFYYYWTGAGGETFLALGAVPITYVLFTLQSLRANQFYPNLPRLANTRSPPFIACSRSIAPTTWSPITWRSAPSAWACGIPPT